MTNIKKICFLVCLLIYSMANSAPPAPARADAVDLHKMLTERDDAYYTYPTQFGDVKFVLDDGTLGTPAVKITLNGSDLISVVGKLDLQGTELALMSGFLAGGNGADMIPLEPGKYGRPMTKRLIVREGPDGNCIKHLLILDFTGKKPFISERFGDNPRDEYCLTFKSAKWGKKESYIKLTNGMTFVYYTGGEVVGPI